MVAAGQLIEASAVLRLSLEQAAYGHYIARDENRYEVWMRRGESEAARKAVRTEFQARKIFNVLKSDDTTLAAIYDKLYEKLIDAGAHPNEFGAMLSTTVAESEKGDMSFDTIYLHQNGVPLDYWFRLCAQVGIWALRAADLVYPERSKLTRARYDLDALIARY